MKKLSFGTLAPEPVPVYAASTNPTSPGVEQPRSEPIMETEIGMLEVETPMTSEEGDPNTGENGTNNGWM